MCFLICRIHPTRYNYVVLIIKVMKKKPDISFIVFLVIIIAGGIYVNYLTASRNRWRETCHYREMEIERMHGSTDFLLRLLFETYKKKWWSGDSIIRIQMDERSECIHDGLQDCMVLYIAGDMTDKLRDRRLSYILNTCKDMDSSRLVVVVDEKCDSVLFEILKAYRYRVFEAGPLGNRLGRETAIFYVGTQRQVQAYLILNDYTLSVLNNYMKLIRDDYLK